ncbi:multisubunit sodium/proton antiporter, MrpC subunit [Caldanaerovirga acetigignens]|uniref:Multisubunit sodium/proton antiporter, MrpC subunit n=1 Tax=Caldanaerovirga acetigignens TaxID=447595 RepID=A0A1M7JJF3_9FIRM|nr:cation:proton antiporter subunit C [Caldanaerovirga acetigignens]SHM53086.1 multisubunit sodium/proton antiporter, MrpC subunit [Caldanaerovirga acetigignens]
MKILYGILNNYYYVAAFALFCIGFYIILASPNLIKKVIGINIMDTSVFLFIVASGYIKGGKVPIMSISTPGPPIYVNPLTTAFVLTGIVIAVSKTAYALTLITKIHDFYGSIDT